MLSPLFVGQSGETWDFWLIASVIFAAIAAGGVGVATTGSIVAHKREARAAELERDRTQEQTNAKVAEAKSAGIAAGRNAADALARTKEADAKIAVASAGAEKARAEAANARADLAKSLATIETTKAQAAEASARAAEAELALVKYRAGRSLSMEQRSTLLAWLQKSPKGRVIVKPNFLNSEATRYANQISEVFKEAGFVGVGDAPLDIVSYNKAGLFLAVRDGSKYPDHTNPILEAFSRAGVQVESGVGNWVPDDQTVVIVVSEQP